MDEIPIRRYHFGDVAVSGQGVRNSPRPMPLRITFDEPGVPGFLDVWHQHDDFFAMYVVSRGRGIHAIDGVPYGIARGDVYLMYPGMRHRYSDHDDLFLDTVFFPPDILNTRMREALAEEGGLQLFDGDRPLRAPDIPHQEGRILHLTPVAYSQMTVAIAELRTEWGRGTLAGDILAVGLFFRLLVFLSRTFKETAPPQSDSAVHNAAGPQETVAAAVRYLDAHFSEPIRIHELASSLYLSPDRFTKLFLSVMGQTPRQYLGLLRVERAKVLLSTTDDPITEIGMESGFDEPAYFARAFRTATGLSPREYRREFGKKG
jgi:AraC-like DNA-binding protein